MAIHVISSVLIFATKQEKEFIEANTTNLERGKHLVAQIQE